MKLRIDKQNDALYFHLDESAVVESEEVQPGVILDFNNQGSVVGIELLNIRSWISAEKLNVIQFETA